MSQEGTDQGRRVRLGVRTVSRFAGYALIMLSAVLFGINGSLSRLLFDRGVTPITLVEFRMIVGGVCLLVFLLLGQRQSFKFSWRGAGWVLLFGLSLALVTYTYFVAISRLPIAIVLVIQFTGPAWMVLFTAIWRRRLPSWYLLVALGLTVIGVILVTDVWHQQLVQLDTTGLFFAFCALLTFIAYLLLGRQSSKYLPSITGTAYGAVVASVFWLIIQPPWSIPADTWRPQTFILIILVGIVGMALPFSLSMAGLHRLDATHAGIAAMFELPASAIIAFFWLGQSLDLWEILGCVLVLVGITVVQLER